MLVAPEDAEERMCPLLIGRKNSEKVDQGQRSDPRVLTPGH